MATTRWRENSSTTIRSCGAASAPAPTSRASADATATSGTAPHLNNPRDVVPESNMPGYPWLSATPADARLHPGARCACCAKLGVPYTDDEIAKAARASSRARPRPDALIAYLQGLGTALKASQVTMDPSIAFARRPDSGFVRWSSWASCGGPTAATARRSSSRRHWRPPGRGRSGVAGAEREIGVSDFNSGFWSVYIAVITLVEHSRLRVAAVAAVDASACRRDRRPA